MSYRDTDQIFYETAAESNGYFYFIKRSGGNRFIVPHFHSARELLFVESGEVRAIADGEEKILSAGTGCFSDAFGIHSYFTPVAATIYCMVGDGEYFDFVLSALQGVPPRFFNFGAFDKLSSAYENYIELPEKCRRAAFIGALGTAISNLAATYDFAPRKQSGDEKPISSVLKYLQDNFTDDVTLLSVAETLGYTPEYLSALFHKYVREGFRTYLNRLRVRRAKRLIDTGTNVTDAAYESGFGSSQSFYRAFRKEFGILPRNKKS